MIIDDLLLVESTLTSDIENMFIKISVSVVHCLFSVLYSTGMFPLSLVQR